MKNLCLVSVLVTALFACSTDDDSTGPSQDDTDRRSGQQTPSIEPESPGQEAPKTREQLCGAPENYGDLGDLSLVPARLTAAINPKTKGLWTATVFTFPLSKPGEELDVLVVGLLGGHANVPSVPTPGRYDMDTEPFKRNADPGVAGMLLVNINPEEGAPAASYVPVGGSLVIEEVDWFGVSGEAYVKGYLENLNFKEVVVSKHGAAFVDGGCESKLEKLAFDIEVVPTGNSVPQPAQEPPVLEGEPAPAPQDEPTLDDREQLLPPIVPAPAQPGEPSTEPVPL